MFTGLNYQYSAGLSFISTTTYGGGATAAHPYARWYKNGVLLQPVTDYNVGFSQYGVNIINGMIPLNTGDVVRLELYDTVQDRLVAGINNGNGTLLDSQNDTIRPLFSYLETYSPYANGVLSSDTIDQSVIQTTPLLVPKCKVFPINAHIVSSIKIINNRVGDSGSYTHGKFVLNGVDFANADVDESALQTGTFNFVAGVFTHNAENIQLNTFSTLSSNIITYQHNGINTDDDFTFTINNVGFSKISSDGVLNRYVFYGEDVNSDPQFATSTSLYSIEQTPTQYILRVDGGIVRTITRQVVYSSTVGGVSDGTVLPIVSSVDFISSSVGSGYIQASVDGIIARQNITVSAIVAPIFAGGNVYNNSCPSNTFNLGSLTPSNAQSGYTLKWYSDAGLTTQLGSLVLVTTQTVYASYESDDLVSCNGLGTAVTVTINTCATPDVINHGYTTNINTPINGNLSTGATLCDGQVSSFSINGFTSLPFNTGNGNITAINFITGEYTWLVNLNQSGVFTDEIAFNLLCDGIVSDTATETFTIVPPTANAVNDSTTTPINTPVDLNLTPNDTVCSYGATTWEINSQSVNGQATINVNTGVLTFTPYNNFYGLATGTYNILCGGLVIDSATWSVMIIAPTGTIDITNATGGLAELSPSCGETNVYKEKFTTTPNTVLSPITRIWTVDAGAVILGSATDEVVIIKTNAGFTGSYNLTLTTTTPIGVFVKSIEITSDCPIVITEVPVIETICIEAKNSIIKGTTLPNSIVYLYNENTALLTQITADTQGNFVINMDYWYNFGQAFLIKAQAPSMEKSDYTAFIIKCNMSCCTTRKKKKKSKC